LRLGGAILGSSKRTGELVRGAAGGGLTIESKTLPNAQPLVVRKVMGILVTFATVTRLPVGEE